MPYGYGMGPGWWVLMALLCVALVAAIVWAIVRLPRGAAPATTRDADDLRPEAILDRRLARGEIDSQAYDALLSKLREAEMAPR